MRQILCWSCQTKLTIIDIFKAGLPSKVKCGECGTPITFNFNPFIFYPICTLLALGTIYLGYLSGNMLHGLDVLPIKKRHLVIGCVIVLLVIFELLLSLCMMNFTALHNSEKKNLS